MAPVHDLTSGEPPRPQPPEFADLDLDALRTVFAQAAAVLDETTSDADLIDRMTRLVALRNSVDAALASTELAFARTHAAAQTAGGHVEPENLERSIGTQIGLANQASPVVGRTRMHTARDLHDGLDHVRSLFAAGQLNQYRVSIIVQATAHLDRTERADLDRRLAELDLARLGVGQLREQVRLIAAQVAPEKFHRRSETARTQRRVTIRQAADGMVDLTAHLPVEQGVACYAALHKAFTELSVNPAPLTRSRGQVMADTLVERLTGQHTAEHVNVEVQVVVPIEALLDPDSPLPAEIPGHGPIPVAFLARTRGRKTLRRLITSTGIVIGGDSQSRCFPQGLADLIRARDRHRCTEPYCDAPARQTDHIIQAGVRGPTDYRNGRSVCELHNYLREQPGWWVEPTPDGTRTTTPTGHTYSAPRPVCVT